MSPFRNCLAKSAVPVALLAIVCAAAVSGSIAFCADKKPAKRKLPKIRISKETTFVKGPLRKDGYVDYVAALNAHASRGVTAKNNAAVLLARSLGPAIFDKSIRKEFFAKLGIPVPAKEGRYFLSMSGFSKRVAGKNSDAYSKVLFNQQEQGAQRPWSRREFPKLAAWLDYNKQPLALVHAATTRTAYYHPLVTGSDGMLLAAFFEQVQESRSFARALIARAMLAVQEGRIADAQKDLLACHRLARLAGKGQTLIDGLVGYAIEAITCQAAVVMLQSGRLTDRQLSQYQQALAKLSPLPPVNDSINIGERFMMLDAALYGAKHGPNALTEVLGASEENDARTTAVLKRVFGNVDWNIVLAALNDQYDRLYAIGRKTRFVERRKAWAKYEEHLGELRSTMATRFVVGLILGGTLIQGKVSKLMGDIMVTLLAPAAKQARISEDRTVTRTQLLRIAVALERYRKANGRFPRGLNGLTPKFARKLPVDLFPEKPFLYRRTGTGYLLYSVGENMKDDRGQTFDSQPPGDDIVVRMVLKK